MHTEDNIQKFTNNFEKITNVMYRIYKTEKFPALFKDYKFSWDGAAPYCHLLVDLFRSFILLGCIYSRTNDQYNFYIDDSIGDYYRKSIVQMRNRYKDDDIKKFYKLFIKFYNEGLFK